MNQAKCKEFTAAALFERMSKYDYQLLRYNGSNCYNLILRESARLYIEMPRILAGEVVDWQIKPVGLVAESVEDVLALALEYLENE